MSATTTTRTLFAVPASAGRGHRIRLLLGAGLAIGLSLALLLYGFDYYTLDVAHRPFSPKHEILKPSGTIGFRLGMLGALLFIGIYLYPIRKRWPWLARQGNTKHWLDVHVLLGLTAPVVIAFHSAFKFRGIAGVAFWIMAAVAVSGVVGRYLYAQIPRSLSAAEVSMKDLRESEEQLSQELAAQRQFSPGQLSRLFESPRDSRVEVMPAAVALWTMMAIDLRRPFYVAALRRAVLNGGAKWLTLGGFLSCENAEVEEIIRIARTRAGLSKRILFLSRSQQVFHLWHVVHRPFSYSFSVLACIHILVVLLFGVM